MTVQSWDTSLIGVNPTDHPCSVLVVPGSDATMDRQVLDELRGWGWAVTIVEPDTVVGALAEHAADHDVALFCDIRGTHASRRALTALLPTVAIVPPRRRGRAATLLREAGARRDTTVLIVRDARDTKVLRRLCGSALVRAGTAGTPGDRAAALGAVLLRAHAWQFTPAARVYSRPVAAAG